MFLHTDNRDSDQADLSLRWVHRSFCWFCHAAAHNNRHGIILVSELGSSVWVFNEKASLHRFSLSNCLRGYLFPQKTIQF